ncbi:MAG: DUF1573 domain-containing protein [Anaerolineae bacterium]|nr:DUF1573 domain-containing protein [Anaerolineae bacterium]
MTRQKKPSAPTRPPWLIPVAIIGVVLAVLAVVLLALRGNSSTPYTPEVSGRPNITVDKEVIDFGEVRFGQPVSAVFTVKNTGDQTLTIQGEPLVELLQGC